MAKPQKNAKNMGRTGPNAGSLISSSQLTGTTAAVPDDMAVTVPVEEPRQGLVAG